MNTKNIRRKIMKKQIFLALGLTLIGSTVLGMESNQKSQKEQIIQNFINASAQETIITLKKNETIESFTTRNQLTCELSVIISAVYTIVKNNKKCLCEKKHVKTLNLLTNSFKETEFIKIPYTFSDDIITYPFFEKDDNIVAVSKSTDNKSLHIFKKPIFLKEIENLKDKIHLDFRYKEYYSYTDTDTNAQKCRCEIAATLGNKHLNYYFQVGDADFTLYKNLQSNALSNNIEEIFKTEKDDLNIFLPIQDYLKKTSTLIFLNVLKIEKDFQMRRLGSQFFQKIMNHLQEKFGDTIVIICASPFEDDDADLDEDDDTDEDKINGLCEFYEKNGAIRIDKNESYLYLILNKKS